MARRSTRTGIVFSRLPAFVAPLACCSELSLLCRSRCGTLGAPPGRGGEGLGAREVAGGPRRGAAVRHTTRAERRLPAPSALALALFLSLSDRLGLRRRLLCLPGLCVPARPQRKAGPAGSVPAAHPLRGAGVFERGREVCSQRQEHGTPTAGPAAPRRGPRREPTTEPSPAGPQATGRPAACAAALRATRRPRHALALNRACGFILRVRGLLLAAGT